MFVWRDCSWRTCQLLFVCKVFFSHPVGTSEKCGETGVILAIMISNLLSFTAFLHGVLVSYGAFVCVLLKDCPPLFATKVIHGIMVPSFFCISKVFVWKCVWPLYLSLSLFISPPLFLLVVPQHMSSDALYPIFSSWSILLLYIMSFHSSF